MAVRIGILGMGGMGNCHFNAYRKIPGARVVAACDIDPQKLERIGQLGFNLRSGSVAGPAAKLRCYGRAETMFADPGIDVVDITLPTDLHAPYAIKALKAGKHVICEKPMALDARAAARMVAAAKANRRQLFVAHCIRFWPAYVQARKIIRMRAYGRVLSAVFRRLSSSPGSWTSVNWFMDPRRSGGCPLDLHIHDADYVLHLFGRPRSVTARVCGLTPGRADHIVALYDYGPHVLVQAESAWEYAPGHGFEMTFTIACERATLVFGKDGRLLLHPKRGKSRALSLPAGDGYTNELKHFVACIRQGRRSEVITPESAARSVRLIEAELESARRGRAIPVRF
jgi:predicted dehydrogenase